MTTTTEIRKFRKGEKIHLDEIYDIQGIAGGRWWERDDPSDDLCETLYIVEDITIAIKVTRGKSNEKVERPCD